MFKHLEYATFYIQSVTSGQTKETIGKEGRKAGGKKRGRKGMEQKEGGKTGRRGKGKGDRRR